MCRRVGETQSFYVDANAAVLGDTCVSWRIRWLRFTRQASRQVATNNIVHTEIRTLSVCSLLQWSCLFFFLGMFWVQWRPSHSHKINHTDTLLGLVIWVAITWNDVSFATMFHQSLWSILLGDEIGGIFIKSGNSHSISMSKYIFPLMIFLQEEIAIRFVKWNGAQHTHWGKCLFWLMTCLRGLDRSDVVTYFAA